MQQMYQVTIHGKILEGSDLKKLLSRAVTEKKTVDRKFRPAFPPGTVRIAGEAGA